MPIFVSLQFIIRSDMAPKVLPFPQQFQEPGTLFNLPFRAETARLIISPVPWEVTLPTYVGTSRAPEHILRTSQRLYPNLDGMEESWKQGLFMPEVDKHMLMRSDYLRKEAELYIRFLMEGGNLAENEFLRKTLEEVNRGCGEMTDQVYGRCSGLLKQGKLVGILGGDHSTALGLIRALGEKEGAFGILQIDAHCDLRSNYLGFTSSHATVMRNALDQVPTLETLAQVGVRDYIEEELGLINEQPGRIIPFFDARLWENRFQGMTWTEQCDRIISVLPGKVYLSLDIDGLDPKLCPRTCFPVPGGLELSEVYFLLEKLLSSGRKLIGFDLTEVSYGPDEWDAQVASGLLFRLAGLLIRSQT